MRSLIAAVLTATFLLCSSWDASAQTSDPFQSVVPSRPHPKKPPRPRAAPAQDSSDADSGPEVSRDVPPSPSVASSPISPSFAPAPPLPVAPPSQAATPAPLPSEPMSPVTTGSSTPAPTPPASVATLTPSATPAPAPIPLTPLAAPSSSPPVPPTRQSGNDDGVSRPIEFTRYYVFPLPAPYCDDGGAANGTCATIVGIDKFEPGKQTWFIRWTSLGDSYRNLLYDNSWITLPMTCEAISDGFACKSRNVQQFPSRYRGVSSIKFLITQGGEKREWDYSLPTEDISIEGREIDVPKPASPAPSVASLRTSPPVTPVSRVPSSGALLPTPVVTPLSAALPSALATPSPSAGPPPSIAPISLSPSAGPSSSPIVPPAPQTRSGYAFNRPIESRRYYAFPLPAPDCDDGGAANGTCTAIVGIDKFEPGKQTWYIRWTSLTESYRSMTSENPWRALSMMCETTGDGYVCKTRSSQQFPPRYRGVSSIQFVITQGGARLEWDYSLPTEDITVEGRETDVNKFTSLAPPG